ncbi:MAG: DNA-processing protein DprA [Paludibacteraceae bacterium]|nr:DNA-processing protein DprA [Paludibacteraceae bacterium]
MEREDKILNAIALTKIDGLGVQRIKVLLDHFGSADELWSVPLNEVVKIGGQIGELLSNKEIRASAFRRAEQEMVFAEKHGITMHLYGDGGYPVKMIDCPDAPIVLYQLGNTSLNNRHFVAMVGTRHATQYGRNMARHIVSQLAEKDKNIVIVSGLAYGIDIESHRAALDFGLDTIAVLAHGLDRIYPAAHRKYAAEIIEKNGALLTEFTTMTEPVGFNFLQRNRIVAGICDATIVVESGERGGSMSTARISVEYNRELFAVPGRIDDKVSAGCNRLISDHKAEMFINADDFFAKMGWQYEKEQELPLDNDVVELTGIQEKIYKILKERGQMQINEIVGLVDEPIGEVSSALAEMVFDDVIEQMAGDVYDLTTKSKLK